MPRSVPRVVRRGNSFYFRMAVPRLLIGRLGKREVKVSLRTCNPVDANVRGRMLSNALDLLFAGLPEMKNTTTERIKDQIRVYFQQCLNTSLEHSYLLPTDPGWDLGSEIAYLQAHVEQLRAQLKSQSFEQSVRLEAREVLAAAGQSVTDTDALQHACNAVVRAKMEDARILAARLSGDVAALKPTDPFFADMEANDLPPLPGEAAPPSKHGQTLAAIATQFYNFKVKHDWTSKTAADVKRVLALASAVIGPERQMRSLNIDDVKAVRDAIAQVPPNYMKSAAGKGMSVQHAIAANTGGTTLSLKTQDKYFTMFRQLLIWAVNEGYLEKMPGAGVKVAGVGKTNPADRRNPYTIDQLRAIFKSPQYTGHKSDRARNQPGSIIIRDGKFWVPLIALYSGMRMGEIVQLLASDVKDDAGIWYFDINKDEGNDKKIKTATSKRRVPIHHVLLDAGLLSLVAVKKGKGRIFADIECGTDGYFSHNLSKWWGRYSRKVGFFSPKTAFHSFRHNFKDALQAADVHEYLTRALIGHADKSVHAQYGSGPSLKALNAAVDKVEYQLDLSFLANKVK